MIMSLLLFSSHSKYTCMFCTHHFLYFLFPFARNICISPSSLCSSLFLVVSSLTMQGSLYPELLLCPVRKLKDCFLTVLKCKLQGYLTDFWSSAHGVCYSVLKVEARLVGFVYVCGTNKKQLCVDSLHTDSSVFFFPQIFLDNFKSF